MQPPLGRQQTWVLEGAVWTQHADVIGGNVEKVGQCRYLVLLILFYCPDEGPGNHPGIGRHQTREGLEPCVEGGDREDRHVVLEPGERIEGSLQCRGPDGEGISSAEEGQKVLPSAGHECGWVRQHSQYPQEQGEVTHVVSSVRSASKRAMNRARMPFRITSQM